MFSGVVPTEMLTAGCALAKGPRVAWKPGVFEGRHAGLAASVDDREGHDVEPQAVRVAKAELVFAVVFEPVPFIGNPTQARGTKPVPFGISNRHCGPGVHGRLAEGRHHQFCCFDGRAIHELSVQCGPCRQADVNLYDSKRKSANSNGGCPHCPTRLPAKARATARSLSRQTA